MIVVKYLVQVKLMLRCLGLLLRVFMKELDDELLSVLDKHDQLDHTFDRGTDVNFTGSIRNMLDKVRVQLLQSFLMLQLLALQVEDNQGI